MLSFNAGCKSDSILKITDLVNIGCLILTSKYRYRNDGVVVTVYPVSVILGVLTFINDK